MQHATKVPFQRARRCLPWLTDGFPSPNHVRPAPRYTPGEFEERVPAGVIRMVVQRGSSRADPSKLMLETKHMFHVTFPFSPSSPKFASLTVPKTLELDFAQKI